MMTVLLFAFPIAMILAAASDLATMTIPNRLVLGLTACFPIFALAAGWSAGEMAIHALAGIAVLAMTFGCFAAGWMGGGDAKMIAAAGLWLGPSDTLATFALWTSVFGGGLTLAFLLARACLSPTTGLASVDRLLSRDTGIPYGVAIGAAGLLVTPSLFAALPG